MIFIQSANRFKGASMGLLFALFASQLLAKTRTPLLKKQQMPYAKRTDLCLEPEHYPDAPNQKAFPSTTLKPNETYKTRMIWVFSAQ